MFDERESQFTQEIENYRNQLEDIRRENQTVQSQLLNLEEEKMSNEKLLNDMMISITEDFEKQIKILTSQNVELQETCSFFFCRFSLYLQLNQFFVIIRIILFDLMNEKVNP